ncbi:MAG TPA: hypothetical protein VMV77_01350 [Bacteroidales bacterium]|nr:hypothetical protein [Bacteroidales bacterium]
MENALSYLTALPSNIEERQQFFRKVKDEILDEAGDPLIILRQIKSATKLFESILEDKDIDYLFLTEAEKYGKSFDHAGARFSIQETGTQYEYKACGDPEWDALSEQIKELTEEKKKRQNFLKAIPFEGTFDQATGTHISRAPKTSKTSVVVTV